MPWNNQGGGWQGGGGQGPWGGRPGGGQQPPDLEELLRNQREGNAQYGGSSDTDEDRLFALIGWKACRGETDHDGIVAGKDEIDCYDLEKR